MRSAQLPCNYDPELTSNGPKQLMVEQMALKGDDIMEIFVKH
jgi:hypothetical protein